MLKITSHISEKFHSCWYHLNLYIHYVYYHHTIFTRNVEVHSTGSLAIQVTNCPLLSATAVRLFLGHTQLLVHWVLVGFIKWQQCKPDSFRPHSSMCFCIWHLSTKIEPHCRLHERNQWSYSVRQRDVICGALWSKYVKENANCNTIIIIKHWDLNFCYYVYFIQTLKRKYQKEHWWLWHVI